MSQIEKDIVLDEQAEELYKMLGGLDTSNRVTTETNFSIDGLDESLAEEEKLLETWRTILIELVYNLAGFIASFEESHSKEHHAGDIGAILGNLSQVAAMPGQDGRILIRFRGWSGSDPQQNFEKFDYTISSGHVTIDIESIKDLSRRHGIKASHLPGHLIQALQSLAVSKITSICLFIGNWTQVDTDRMQQSLRGLGKFFHAMQKSGTAGEQPDTPALVLNEHKLPDPNLTMVANLNRLPVASFQQLVAQVENMMYGETVTKGLESYPCVYDAIFAFKKFQEKLQKPAIEINNNHWLLVKRGQENLSPAKAQLSHFLTKAFGNSPEKIARILEGVYGDSYRDVSAQILIGILNNLSDLFAKVEPKEDYAAIIKEAMANIKSGFDQIIDETLDMVDIEQQQVATGKDKNKLSSNKLHSELLLLFSFFKKRANTNKKLKKIMAKETVFNSDDLETLAKDFNITAAEVELLIGMFRECFTDQGRFNRRIFENNIPQFLKFEKKVFAFLWLYLKEIEFRDDRVAYLNSLQLLIAKMTEPQKALNIILRDFSKSPDSVSFSDRNGLILANILVRKYNKELHNHIELTPEEVLLVQEGLNRTMTSSAAGFIDNDPERFFFKARTLHKSFIEALQSAGTDKKTMPVHYLITLERELYILLSLVGGMKAHKIIRSAVREYGSPGSLMYSLIRDQEQMKSIFQLLQLATRGLARFEDINDIKLLRDVGLNKQAFIELNPALLGEEQISKVMDYVDQSIRKISGEYK